MSTLLDHRVGMKKESTFGTPVTPDRFYPRLDATQIKWDARRRTAAGIQSGGRRSQLGARTFLPTGQGTATVKVELASKQAGVLLEAALGQIAVNTITGGAQMVADPAISGTLMPSYTIQTVDVDNTGTELVKTAAGCTPVKATIEQPEDGIATLTVEFDVLSYTTVTAAATKSYPSGATLFDAYQVTCGLGGTLTVPTTTAVASGLNAFNDFRSWQVEIDHSANTSRWNLSGGVRKQPTVGIPKIGFSGSVEHNASTVPGLLVAGTLTPWYSLHTTAETLGAGVTQLQVVIPQLAIKEGLPEPKMDGSTSVFPVSADVDNDGTNKDLYVVYRTTDTAA
jgi:hypothetical protein